MAKVYVCWAVDEVIHGDGVPPDYCDRIDRGTLAMSLVEAKDIATAMVRSGQYRGVLVLDVEDGEPVQPALFLGIVSGTCCQDMWEWGEWIEDQIQHAEASTICGHARRMVEIPL